MTVMDLADIPGLWASWTEGRSRQERERLILHYRPLVDQVAGSMVARLPRNVEREDLAGYGILGLIDAVERYDHTRGVPFEPFAQQRIKGAILDGIRGVAWEPRSVRSRARDITHTRARLEQTFGRTVTEAEIATEMGVPIADIARALADMNSSTVGSTTAELAETGDDTDHVTHFPTDIDNLRVALADAIVALPDQKRVVFALYYQEDITLKGIGRMLGVSDVRINQILNDAILILQQGLAGR